MKVIFQTLLLATFAMWFGGFGFYVSFVVPTGTEVLGSAFDQGMITRRVTVPLNWLGVAAGILMMAESYSVWKKDASPRKQIQLGMVLLFLLMHASLFWLHPQIDAFVDQQSSEIVGDYDQFYFLHRLYLWASTVAWVAAWIWLVCHAFRLRNHATDSTE